jgi:copper chaperone
MKTVVKIAGMSCGHCVKSVNNIISDIQGVISVDVSLEQGKAVIEFDENSTTADQIVETINESHYEASL